MPQPIFQLFFDFVHSNSSIKPSGHRHSPISVPQGCLVLRVYALYRATPEIH
ncbi:hypothetical protein Sjap_003525 [Stephania japonica]|uniref:Uncharacterized protein n=1 Tax=Stephania japonica TaxID=461633 RepID=A0AAP0KRK4_9MAGN